MESSVEVFLALSHGQAELAHISWPVGVLRIGMLENVNTQCYHTLKEEKVGIDRSVGNVVAGGVQVRRPSRRVVRHVVPVAAKALG